MLSKKRQRRYLFRQKQNWLVQLKAFDRSHDQDVLHRLRVEFKKIKAFVRLTAAVSGRGASAHFSGLKTMFRRAGRIRDIGNRIRFLEQHRLLSPEEKDRQQQSMEAAADDFAGRIKEYRKKGKRASRHLLMDIHAIPAGSIQQWYALEIIRIGILLTSGTGNLHRARKKIKTLLYVHKMLSGAVAKRVHLNTDYLEKLQEAIGQWHDVMIVAEGRTDKSVAGEGAVMTECREKEKAVQALAGEFYRRARQTV
jgi:CHAD domain-containing protein